MVDFYGPTHFLVEHTTSWASFPVIEPGFTSMFIAYSSSLSHFGRKNIITGNERFQTIFTQVVQHCYETYSVSFVVIGKNNFSFTVYSDLCYTTTIFFAFVTPLVFKLNFWFQVFMWTFVRTGPIVVD